MVVSTHALVLPEGLEPTGRGHLLLGCLGIGRERVVDYRAGVLSIKLTRQRIRFFFDFLAHEPKHNCLQADFRQNLARHYCRKGV